MTSSAARSGSNRATSRHIRMDTTSAKEPLLTTLSWIPRFSDKDTSVNDEVIAMQGTIRCCKIFIAAQTTG